MIELPVTVVGTSGVDITVRQDRCIVDRDRRQFASFAFPNRSMWIAAVQAPIGSGTFTILERYDGMHVNITRYPDWLEIAGFYTEPSWRAVVPVRLDPLSAELLLSALESGKEQ